ncbi:phosphoglycolate phosphatase [Halomonas denitrificans]|uniref:phosphoglycolate phosphatase n=1 Tax=Halomonas TaxID=2745 RepID=UPI001CD66341|nr:MULTISPECIES: phosphoglycolate phosphatase [Halomonas]MCA0974852.1 phosphoglycolate phosphatase [Halomonas denitrificans]MED5294331.1 phosphoglycolate phosphatase [Pseudomonadota bacterium]
MVNDGWKMPVGEALDGSQLVAFDLDGTLIDSVPDLAAAVDAALLDVDLPVAGEARVRDWVGNGSWSLLERALTDALGEAPSEVLCKTAHERFLEHYHRHPCVHTRLYPGVETALSQLFRRGLILCLVTNKPEAFIGPILEHLSIDGYFTVCLGGDTLPRKKPDPMPLRHLCQQFDVSPSQCVMVGDSRHDIQAGKAAGYRTIAVPYGYNHGEPVSLSEPDLIVESLDQLV